MRFYLLESAPHVKLYMTPINIDPDRPALPISHPFTYAVYLSKTQGRYSTLGLAEDTSALNEGVVDEDAFLDLTWQIHEERERMFFDALEKTARGAVVCVFDVTDRLQHMFFRHLDERHPANRGRDTSRHRDAIRDLYTRMDDLVGRTMARLGDDDVLLVMSDHGFKPYRRSVNLNSWLYTHGFLALRNGGPTGADMFADVDWPRTKAYAVGFGGIYLNLAGREARGIVAPGAEAADVKRAIRDGLRELYDEEEGIAPRPRGLRRHRGLLRSLRRGRSRPHRRLPARAPRRLAVGDRRREHGGARGQRPALERRPQLQPARRAGHALLQPPHRRRVARHLRHRPDRAGPVRGAGAGALRRRPSAAGGPREGGARPRCRTCRRRAAGGERLVTPHARPARGHEGDSRRAGRAERGP